MKNNIYCSNCGSKYHEYMNCTESITSLGIILIKLDGNINNNDLVISSSEDTKIVINMNGIRANDQKDIILFSKTNLNVKYLMIQRKHTIGYIDFIRGKYKPENIDGIIFLFQQMTKLEIEKIGKLSFDELWFDFWGHNEQKQIYIQEHHKSKEKFNLLKNNKTELGLSFYVDNVKPSWNEAEWGFPKGRRNKNETNLECAKREFEEETGFVKKDYKVLEEIEPLVEDFIGTNGKKYKHIYYIALAQNDKIPKLDINNSVQYKEIGNINYFTYYEGIKIIRPYHIAKIHILTKLFNFILNNIIINKNK